MLRPLTHAMMNDIKNGSKRVTKKRAKQLIKQYDTMYPHVSKFLKGLSKKVK